jgi:hypothetical protein
MVEYTPTIVYDRITNAAVMVEWLPPKFIALNYGLITLMGLSITLDVPFHPHNYRNPMTKCLEIGAGADNPIPTIHPLSDPPDPPDLPTIHN